jgi:hypothetical protein
MTTMDCKTFDDAMLDELYGELDGAASALFQSHVASCDACASKWRRMKATRQLARDAVASGGAALALPDGLEERLLAAAKSSSSRSNVVPFRGRVDRAISAAGRWAMRPQAAMAAVFLVMMGSSVVLLSSRTKSSPEAAAPAPAGLTLAEEQGVAADKAFDPKPPAAPVAQSATPTAEPETYAKRDSLETAAQERTAMGRAKGVAPPAARPPAAAKMKALDDEFAPESAKAEGFAAAPPPPTNAGTGPLAGAGSGSENKKAAPASPSKPGSGQTQDQAAASPFDTAMSSYRAGRFDDATSQFDEVARGGNNTAALMAARSVRNGHGCKAALTRYDRLTGIPGTIGADATLEEAQCYRSIGNTKAAEELLTSLRKVPSHEARAQAELDSIVAARKKAADAVDSPGAKH